MIMISYVKESIELGIVQYFIDLIFCYYSGEYWCEGRYVFLRVYIQLDLQVEGRRGRVIGFG